jgi:hypothetical protein
MESIQADALFLDIFQRNEGRLRHSDFSGIMAELKINKA